MGELMSTFTNDGYVKPILEQSVAQVILSSTVLGTLS